MPAEVVIVGAGRQGRNALEIFCLDPDRYQVAGFLDDTKPVGTAVLGCPVLGGFGLIDDAGFLAAHAWHVALGNNEARMRIGRRLQGANATVASAIHPVTHISRSWEVGVGIYVGPFVRVGSASRIADWALIETQCSIGPDTVIGDGAFLGPSVVMAGGSAVGTLSFIGAGSVISNDIAVGSNCTIAANAAVVREVPDGARAQGVPARIVTSTKR